MHPSIEQLLRVQDVDAQAIFLRESMRLRPRELDDDRGHVAKANAAVKALISRVRTIKVESDEREVDVKKCDAEIEKLNVALNQASSNQEYTILKEQIKRQEELRSEAEEDVLEKLTQIDSIEVEQKERSGDLSSAEDSLSKKQAELDEMMENIRGELSRLEAQRAGLVAEIDPEHLRTYDRVLQRHNNFAIARVDSQVCQGCYMSVTAQEVNLLMQGQLVQCKSCSRLFHFRG